MKPPRVTTVLSIAAIGTYFLIVIGATTAISDASAGLQIVHAVLAMLVGLLLVVTIVGIWTADTTVPWVVDSKRNQADRRSTIAYRGSRRVRWLLVGVLIIYPLQAIVGMGLLVEWPGIDGRIHLLGAIVVFGLLLLALVWQLETEGSTPDGEIQHRDSSSARSSSPRSNVITGDTAVADVDHGVRSSGETIAQPSDRDRDSTRKDEMGDDSSSIRRTMTDIARAYIALTKPRLMWLLCLLALAGMALAAPTSTGLNGVTVVGTLTGGILAIGAAGTFNHVYEYDRDRRMARTADRPLATDRISRRSATVFGLLLVGLSMSTLLVLVNVLAAVLTAVAIIYYSVIYTVVLKPTTQWNTVIGGGAGALPAVIGYVAVAETIAIPALLLAAVVFCWTPAHFYNLAIAYRHEYERAAYPMLPVVKGVGVTRRRIVFWLGVTLLATSWLGMVSDLGLVFAVTATIAGGYFLWSVVTQYRLDTTAAAVRSFYASNVYLGCLLVVIFVESLVL